jgi:hypothetical protein
MSWLGDLRKHAEERRPFGGRVALGAALAGLGLFVIPAGAAGTESTPPAFTVEGSFTWVGGPDSRATQAVGACPVEQPGPGCASLRLATVAADGSYSLGLPYGKPSTWNVFPILSFGGESFYPPLSFRIGPSTEVTVPRSPHAPVPLTISARAVGLRVVDSEGGIFPANTALVLASTDPEAPVGPAEWSSGGTDAAGNVLLFVDPTALYYVTAMALNTGWPDPTSVGDDGTTFHNADETLLLLGADIEEGTTFVIPKPPGV